MSKENTTPWLMLHLAVRPEGASKLDLPGRPKVDKAMDRHVASGLVVKKKVGKVNYYFTTRKQLSEYINYKPVPPRRAPAPTLVRRAGLTVKAWWSEDAPAHFPVVDGKPAYRITVGQAMPQPTKSNTHREW